MRLLSRVGTTALATLCLSLASPGQPPGEVLIDEPASASAVAEWQSRAEAGEPDACFMLGEHFLSAERSSRVREGIDLLERAAAAGHREAAHRLGLLYERGGVVEHDHRKALEYYRTAATAQHEAAQYQLGGLYIAGRGTAPNFVEGLAWLIVATDNGVSSAGERQVREHLNNTGGGDVIAAAERRANELARYVQPNRQRRTFSGESNSAMVVRPGRGHFGNDGDFSNVEAGSLEFVPLRRPLPDISRKVEKLLTKTPVETGPPVKLVTPRQTIQSWTSLSKLESEAAKNEPRALWALGEVLLDGVIAPQNTARGVELLDRGAKAGNVDAAYKLGELYSSGRYVTKDDAKAFALYLQAAHGTVRPALYNVGASYVNGRGTERNLALGYAWLVAAKKVGVDPGAEARVRVIMKEKMPDAFALAQAHASAILTETGLAKYVEYFSGKSSPSPAPRPASEARP